MTEQSMDRQADERAAKQILWVVGLIVLLFAVAMTFVVSYAIGLGWPIPWAGYPS